MLRVSAWITVAIFVCGIGSASAQETKLWKQIGSWQIRIDRTLDYGCFMVASFSRGTAIRIGLDQNNRNGYVLVGNALWRSLERGKEYQLIFEFDNSAPWRGNATATTMGDAKMVFLHVSFDKPKFLVELARKQSLTIRYRNKVVTSLPLTGSFEATRELVACQTTIEALRGPSQQKDPFVASDKPLGLDPFRQ